MRNHLRGLFQPQVHVIMRKKSAICMIKIMTLSKTAFKDENNELKGSITNPAKPRPSLTAVIC